MILYLLDAITPPDKTVEIIKAIGSIWPLILTVTGVIFLIIYKKQIGEFLSNFNKISGKTKIGEITIENVTTPILTTGEPISSKPESQKLQDIEIVAEEKTDSDENYTWLQIYKELQAQNIVAAETIFSKIQNEMKDPEEKEKNILFLLYLKYIFAGLNTIGELKERGETSTSNSVKFQAFEYLAQCYSHANNYNESLTFRQMALAVALNEDQKAETARHISLCLYELGRKLEALQFLKNVKADFTSDQNKKIIYKAIGDLYDKEQNWVFKSLAYEMALNYAPNDTTLLFDTAYAYTHADKNSTEQLPSLAVLHYKELIQYNRKSFSGFNNLGVALSNFGLDGLAITNYRQAVNLDNTLAASNLAYILINAGLYDEAKELLNKAKEASNTDHNVWPALEYLSKKEKEESEKYSTIIAQAKEEQKFIRNFGETYFDKNLSDVNLSGNWIYESITVQTTVLLNPVYSELKWVSKELNFSVVVPNYGRAAVSYSGNCVPKSGGFSEKLIAFLLIDKDQRSLTILLYTLSDPYKSYFFTFAKEMSQA